MAMRFGDGPMEPRDPNVRPFRGLRRQMFQRGPAAPGVNTRPVGRPFGGPPPVAGDSIFDRRTSPQRGAPEIGASTGRQIPDVEKPPMPPPEQMGRIRSGLASFVGQRPPQQLPPPPQQNFDAPPPPPLEKAPMADLAGQVSNVFADPTQGGGGAQPMPDQDELEKARFRY